MSDQNSVLQLRNFARQKLADHLSISPDRINPFVSTSVKNNDADLLFDGKVYDIKASNPVITQKQKKSLVWDFDLRGNAWENGRNKKLIKDSPTCDFYLLIGMIENAPDKIFLLPSTTAPTSHIRISLTGESKYYQYAI